MASGVVLALKSSIIERYFCVSLSEIMCLLHAGDVFSLDQVTGDQTHQGGLAGTPATCDDVDLLLMRHVPGPGQDFSRRDGVVSEGFFLMFDK